MGLLGWYRKFIPEFSSIATPLTNLLAKMVRNPVSWTEDCETTFRTLKEKICSRSVLQIPDFTQWFLVPHRHLFTDSSCKLTDITLIHAVFPGHNTYSDIQTFDKFVVNVEVRHWIVLYCMSYLLHVECCWIRGRRRRRRKRVLSAHHVYAAVDISRRHRKQTKRFVPHEGEAVIVCACWGWSLVNVLDVLYHCLSDFYVCMSHMVIYV